MALAIRPQRRITESGQTPLEREGFQQKTGNKRENRIGWAGVLENANPRQKAKDWHLKFV